MRARRYVLCALFTLALSYAFSGAQTRNDEAALKVRLCDLYEEPQAYAGKLISVRATIVGRDDPTLEEQAFSKQEPCSGVVYMTIVMELPKNVTPKPNFELQRNDSFKEYLKALKKPARIEATLEGRFDPIFVWRDRQRIRVGQGRGYGKKYSADARLVLRRMSDVVTWPIPRK